MIFGFFSSFHSSGLLITGSLGGRNNHWSGCSSSRAELKQGDQGTERAFAPCMKQRIGLWLAGGFVLTVASRGFAADTELAFNTGPDLTKLSLEELASYPITSVSKHEEQLSKAPAAVYVITQEDLRRSGVTSLPEALRIAPGMDVARIDSHTWAVSTRGFNDQFANKLLVLQDGRSIYTPLFSGVFWDVQDAMLEEIDRIEVVRGPGATLWGANAVNGVINIITKSAKETQGILISAGGGTNERGCGREQEAGKLAE